MSEEAGTVTLPFTQTHSCNQLSGVCGASAAALPDQSADRRPCGGCEWVVLVCPVAAEDVDTQLQTDECVNSPLLFVCCVFVFDVCVSVCVCSDRLPLQTLHPHRRLRPVHGKSHPPIPPGTY